MLAFNVLSRISSAAELARLTRLAKTEYAFIVRHYDGGPYGLRRGPRRRVGRGTNAKQGAELRSRGSERRKVSVWYTKALDLILLQQHRMSFNSLIPRILVVAVRHQKQYYCLRLQSIAMQIVF